MIEEIDDHWGLTELFQFNQHWIINDTEDVLEFNEGHELTLKPGEKSRPQTREKGDFRIPSNDTIRYSDKSVHEKGDFRVNFISITNNLSRNLKEGQIIKGIEFLDYHYNWTKKKRKFIRFVKYYILTLSWVESDNKDRLTIYDKALSDWVTEKEIKRKRPLYFIALIGLVLVFIGGAICFADYRAVFVGAIIGGLSTQIKEIFDLVKDKKV